MNCRRRGFSVPDKAHDFVLVDCQTHRLLWIPPRGQTIFRLPLQEFGQNIGSMREENHHSRATVWRGTVESWFRRPGLISVRQGQTPKGSTPFAPNWFQD
jgi:hypothetical protein